jgi:hypothetical protein
MSQRNKRRRSINQYSDPETWKWLHSNCDKEPSTYGKFICWVPDHSQKGIDRTRNDRRRISIKGKKVLTHVFSYKHHINNDIIYEISHKCHNGSCCRFSHLVDESRKINKSRDGCPGYIFTGEIYIYWYANMILHVWLKLMLLNLKHLKIFQIINKNYLY